MADHAYRVQCTISTASGIAADAVTNTWHVKTANDMTLATWNATAVAFNTFYSGSSFGFSPDLLNVGNVIKIFDYADPKPRVPRFQSTFSVSVGGGVGAPAEVGICLSGKKAAASGDNARQLRGRVYLGPWSTTTVNTARVSVGLRNQIVTAGQVLAHTLSLISPQPVALGVIRDDPADPSEFKTYTTMWVDDAWDIQRRRGLRPSARSTISVP